jgi:phosphoglycerol transferase MdoB-like AlkP superfamily enzyme
MKKSHLSWLYPVFGFLIVILLYLSLSRLLLVVWQFERVADSGGLWFILLQGIRFDLATLAPLLIIPISLLPLLTTNRWTLKPTLWVLKAYFVILTAVLIFLELATPNFIAQFDFRPNILMVEYLKYPKEILSMVMTAYPAQALSAMLITLLLSFGMLRLLNKISRNIRPSIFWSAPLLSVLVFVLCVLAGRSTLDHRPVNPSTVAFSSDPLVNSLALNSTYTVMYALYEKIRYESGDEKAYGTMNETAMLAEIYRAMGMDSTRFNFSDIPTLHRQTPASTAFEPKNLVIILEESLGANYVGKLGGRDITPNLDALADEGIWFEQLYATGTRSVRGIEAVVTGFLPTPARSVVKLGSSQHDFFTIAQLLSDFDYSTSFIYGGEAHFDNMRRFFSQNGFEKIIDEKDYEQPDFYGSWGVSDGDLFDKAHETFRQQHDSGKPFFSLVFTSSNHSPFDFPDGQIELVEQPKATVSNAVKYTDHALGEYIKMAKQSPYWEDTIFLIIADHSDRVFGSELVPISQFRIPGLILGAGVKPKVVNRITSQVDMLPTMLSMIGITSSHPAIGIDLTRSDLTNVPGRAIMQYGGNQAYMEGEDVVIHQKNLPLQQYRYKDGVLTLATSKNSKLQDRARAHALWPMFAYKTKSYRLPEKDNKLVDSGN